MAKTKHYITKADVETKDGLKRLEISVPEWGGTLILKQIPADDAMEFGDMQDRLVSDGMSENIASYEMLLRVIAASAVDEEGNKLFTVDDLRVRGLDVIQRLGVKALSMLGISENAIKEATENLKKIKEESSPST